MRTIDNDILLREICSQLSQGKKVRLRAKGNSMRPFIHGGEDLLLLTPPKNLRKGDIVLARIDGTRYVIHRILKMNGVNVTLMGDGNLYATEECSLPDIYGSLESLIRNKKEYKLNTSHIRIMATAWRWLLPWRRLKAKISKKTKRK